MSIDSNQTLHSSVSVGCYAACVTRKVSMGSFGCLRFRRFGEDFFCKFWYLNPSEIHQGYNINFDVDKSFKNTDLDEKKYSRVRIT